MNIEKITDNNDKINVTISLDSKHSIVILNDFQIQMRFNVFVCEFISELRKTLLGEKIWCDNDSPILNSFDSHFTVLKSIDYSKCAVLFLMNIHSLKRRQFVDYLKLLQRRMKDKSTHFTLISIFCTNVIKQLAIVEKKLSKEMYKFIRSEIFDKGISLDPKADLKHMTMYTVSNVLPIIVSTIYSPHQLVAINMEEFYLSKITEGNEAIQYSVKPMHLWSCSDLASWLEMKNYPVNLIDDIENKNVNGCVIQHATPEDLRDFLGITNPLLRRKLIDDIFGYLNDNDIRNNIWKGVFKNDISQSRKVLIINEFSEKDEINMIFDVLKSSQKYSFCYDYSQDSGNLLNTDWSPQNTEISKSKIIIIIVNSKTLNSDGKLFDRKIEKKILFAIWLKKPILFMLTNVNFLRLDQAFKILIENQPILNCQQHSNESLIKLLTQIFDAIISHRSIDISKFGIPTIESFEQQDQSPNLPKIFTKRKIVLHFHSECRKKIDIIKGILEKNEFVVNNVSVDQVHQEFEHYLESSQQVREEIFLDSNLTLCCLSENYIQNNQTKTDLKLLCQLLHKNVIVVLLQRLQSLKSLPKIEKILLCGVSPGIKPKLKNKNSLLKLDLSENQTFKAMLSNLVSEVKKNI